ncbi:C1q-like domain-containing protein [Sphingomonas sp.]|uniref:C1q-like domain-containing protein n=1 Tax=Sphingomonas sp. TaxID=28214 RepID=UPI002FD91EA0
MTVEKIVVTGARGESYADVLRRIGLFGVLPGDSDAEAVSKINADAAASAATAEAAAGPTYASKAAGLAATSVGEAFAVDNGDGTVTVYLKDGDTNPAQRTLATTAAITAVTRDVTWNGPIDLTGLVDSRAALQLAINAGLNRLPAGTFKVGGDLVVPETWCGFLEGAGSGLTRLVFTSGGLKLPCKGNPNGSYHIKGVRGMTIATTTVGTDTAIGVYRTDAASIDTDILLEDVTVIGADGIYGTATGPAKYWATLVNINQCRFVTLRSCRLHGGGPGKTGVGIKAHTTDSDAQFFLSLTDTKLDGCTKAFEISGWWESIYITNSMIYGCRDGLSFARVGAAVGDFSIENTDIFASREPMALSNINNVNIGAGVKLARGFIEPGYNSAFQESGAIGNSTDGYHYPGAVLKVSSSGGEGQVSIDGKMFSAFGDTTDFIRLTDIVTFNVNAICYGAATGSGLSLLGNTKQGGWGNLVIDARGSTIGYGVSIASTCAEIQGGILNTDANVRINDPADVLGKYRAAFSAYSSATLTDKTGDGSFYLPILGTAAFNAGSGYNLATGIFTAPCDGIYHFNFSAKLSGLLSAHTDASVLLVTPAGNRTEQFNPFAEAGTSTLSRGVSATVQLNAGQTVNPLVVVSNGTKVVDLLGTMDGTAFDGHLVRTL